MYTTKNDTLYQDRGSANGHHSTLNVIMDTSVCTASAEADTDCILAIPIARESHHTAPLLVCQRALGIKATIPIVVFLPRSSSSAFELQLLERVACTAAPLSAV